jgi:hypothetical protein
MKKFLRVTLKGEPTSWYDVPVPDNFNMNQVVHSLQAAGYVCFDMLWVPYSELKSLSIITVQNGGEVVTLRPVS